MTDGGFVHTGSLADSPRSSRRQYWPLGRTDGFVLVDKKWEFVVGFFGETSFACFHTAAPGTTIPNLIQAHMSA